MLKRYYGLSEAAEFLSAEHKRQISVSDVMEMAARREIRLCLWCDGVLGIFEYQEIGVSTRFLGPPYSFCGYIGVPARSIAPRGGLPRFDQVFVVEEIHPPESKMPQLPHVDYPQFVGFIGDHESILNMGANGVRSALLNCTLLPVPFTPNIDEMVVPAADLLGLSPNKSAQRDKPGERAETTYLNIIGGLLNLMLSKTPAGKPQSVFSSQSAIIDTLLAHYSGNSGISKRTLEEKFAEAKRSLTAT